jgi:hypothetical protein
VLYASICMKYMSIKLVSTGKENGQIFKGFLSAFQHRFRIWYYEGKTNQDGLKLNGMLMTIIYWVETYILYRKTQKLISC